MTALCESLVRFRMMTLFVRKMTARFKDDTSLRFIGSVTQKLLTVSVTSLTGLYLNCDQMDQLKFQDSAEKAFNYSI